jgi:type IV secretion system protein VirD4
MFGDNSKNRFGQADWATEADLEAAELFDKRPHSIFVGFFNGREVYFHGPAGMVLTAGARAGKLRDVLSYNLLTGTCLSNIVMLDPKREGYAISANQTADGKFVACWNPSGFANTLQDRIDPLPTMVLSNPNLVSDIKVLWENLIAPSGASNSRYFEGLAQVYGEAISLALVEMMGKLTLPDLYDVISMLPGGGDRWLDFAYQMSKSQFPQVIEVEVAIAASRGDSSGGFRGIVGELTRAVACLSDPMLMASVSPPFTMSLESLLDADQRWQLYLSPPVEYLSAWAPVIKTFFVSLNLLKSRAPSAPRILFIIDEVGQIVGHGSGGFPLVPRLFTYGAGIGITPLIVLQSNRQMRALGPDAESLIMSSAAAKLAFGIRDIESAADLSRIMGAQTLTYDDRLAQQQAVHARNEAARALFSGGDPLQAGLAIAHQSYVAEHQSKQQRQLMFPDEVMNMDSRGAIYIHEEVKGPIALEREPYFGRRELAGRFLPNPYHPPADSVTVQTRWGKRTRRVITESVPERFAHFPQYRDGFWTRVDM